MPTRQPSRARAREASRPAPRDARGRRAAFTLIALSLPVAAAAAVEIGLRLAGVGYPSGFFIRVPGREAYTTNPRFGWRFFPPELARTPLVALVPAAKAPDAYRIVVIGESAAMGVPEPAFGFARVLEAMLADAFPARRFEVVNTAMTAVNSHVLVEIARDAARLQPDLFIVYAGHNEVVGPFGPATVFGRPAPALPLVRARVLLSRTRTGQALAGALGRRARPAFPEWRGMEMLTSQRLAEGEPRLEAVYTGYRRNLAAIVERGLAAGARVVVAAPASNLADHPPFASAHRPDLPAGDRARWERLRADGERALAAGRALGAIEAFEAALAIDDRFAELHFRLGQAWLRAGDRGKAYRHFARARDLDLLRFRADSRIEAIAREVAERFAPRGVRFLDSARALAVDAPGGAETFWEHVHLTFEGNYRLAAALFGLVAPLVPRAGRAPDEVLPREPLSREACASRLGLTDWDRYRMAAGMLEMMRRPPFTGQTGHEARIEALRRRVLDLAARARATIDEAERVRRAALAARPDDLFLRAGLAMLLRERGALAEAAAQWEELLRRVPGVAEWRAQLAFALADAGAAAEPDGEARLARAEAIARELLAEQPQLPAVHVNLGTVLERRGRRGEAEQAYRRALELNPGYELARLNLAAILADRGALDEAIALLEGALAIDPQSVEVLARLGVLHERRGRLDEAAAAYRRALAIDPDVARVRNALGYVLERQGDVEGALREYRRALASDPAYTTARLNLADLLLKQGRARAAAAELEEALVHDPASVPALVGLAWLRASAESPLADPPRAVALAERAVALTGGSPEAWRVLARAYATAGRGIEAFEAARRGAEAARARGDARLAEALDEQARRLRRGGR
jgi:tetratricopeptide (TPR) repeat protein